MKNTSITIMTAVLILVFALIAVPASAGQQLQTPPGAAMIDSSDQIADRIIKSKKPVLVDFWAVWCGPCRMLNPIVKELEKEYKGKVEFMKVNVDQHRAIASYFQVSSIPAVFIIKDKTVINAILGLRDKAFYKQALETAIAAKVPPPDTTAQKDPAGAGK